MVIFDGLMLFAQFSWSPQGRGIKLWPFWILPHCRSPSWKDLRPWTAARTCTYRSFACSVKMLNGHSTWCSFGAEGILREFLSPWRKSGIDRNQKFCTASPETDFSVIAQLNQPTASIFDVTLSYNSSSLTFPVPVHFFCLILHHSMWTTTSSWSTGLVK